jgi:DNA repair exonuclease SbcCD ATPase subunit
MATEQARLQLNQTQGLDAGAARKLQDELAALKRKHDARGTEIEEMEAEKYTMAEDIENLQEELEDANRQQKKYYEALMAKDEQVGAQ